MDKIKSWLKKSLFIVLLVNYKRILFQKIRLNKYDDETWVCKSYQKTLGRELDLENPKRFTEKLQWLKLNHRNPIMSKIVDKIALREYLSEKGYGEYTIPVFATYNSVKEIDFNNLPERCIFKASCGSNMLLIKNGKIKHIWLWKAIMNSWLKMNIYVEGREWPYKDAKRGIVCEYFVEAKTENKLKDYKFYCFSGEPKYFQIDSDLLKNHTIDFYTIDCERIPVQRAYPNSNKEIPKSVNFDLMVNIAKDLSKDFPHVRVDFFEYDDTIKISEMTFFDFCGFSKFEPDEYDYIFGDMLKLEKF